MAARKNADSRDREREGSDDSGRDEPGSPSETHSTDKSRAEDNAAATNEELSEQEQQEVERHSRLTPMLVYETVREEGVRELRRPVSSLWWSGVAAGMTIGLSVFGEALLREHLPDAPWTPLVASIGYTFGFLVVILSRHQLFTENTITPVLPLMVDLSRECFLAVGRLWAVVAVANLAGAAVFAAFWTYVPVTGPETLAVMQEMARHDMEFGWWEKLVRAVAAGFLMASLVWLLPSAEAAAVWTIVIVIYLISLADFVHIVSGGVEALLLVFAGEMPVRDFFLDFGAPAFIGNVIGGTGLFSMIVYAQIRRELAHGKTG